MQFNVAQLLKESVGSTRKYEISEELDDLDPDLVIQQPIEGTVKFTKLNQGLLITGNMETVIEVNCGRCLDPFDVAIEIEVEEEFRPTLDIQTGAHLPVGDEDDDATLIDDKNCIDLSEVVRQQLLLALPNHPLCRDDCKGLCPTCGQNFNEGTCNCQDDTIDPRWEALKTLRDTPSPNGSKKKRG